MDYVTYSVHAGLWHGNCSVCAVAANAGDEAASAAVCKASYGGKAGLRHARQAFFLRGSV